MAQRRSRPADVLGVNRSNCSGADGGMHREGQVILQPEVQPKAKLRRWAIAGLRDIQQPKQRFAQVQSEVRGNGSGSGGPVHGKTFLDRARNDGQPDRVAVWVPLRGKMAR